MILRILIGEEDVHAQCWVKVESFELSRKELVPRGLERNTRRAAEY